MAALPKSFWSNEQTRLLAILRPRLEAMAVAAAKQAAKKAGIGFNPALANAQAAQWARNYTDELLKQLGTTSEKGVGEIVGKWIESPGATYGDLQKALIKFGAVRAQAIAVTETTRAYSEGEMQAYIQEGITEWAWRTNHDELVCTVCGPINGKVVKIGEPFGVDHKGNPIKKPPAHTGCRCWTAPVVKPKEKPAAFNAPAPLPGMAEPAPTVSTPAPTPAPAVPPLDHGKLKTVNLHASEPTWKIPPNGKNLRYGGVIFDDDGRVLLRKPTGNFDGYAWTFPKGGGKPGEHPVDIAVREVEQESGHTGQIVGVVPSGYESGSSRNYFFVMRSQSQDAAKMDKETEATIWATPDEAVELIKQSTNAAGRERDLNILGAAVKANAEILAGKDMSYLYTAPPSIPEPAEAKKPKAKTSKPKTATTTSSTVEPPAPAYKPEPVPEPNITLPPKPTPRGFPGAPQELTLVKALGGSTGAKLMQDATGKQFVVKKGASRDHLLEEAQADALYQALGVKVPKYQVYDTPEGPVKVAEYLPGARTLGQVLESGTPAEVKKVKAQLQGNLAVDALLSNWDVVGLNADNILVDEKGQAWRVDNGGSLRFRAQGGRKAEFDEFPTELWTLRGKIENSNAAKVFGDVKYAEVVEQMRTLTGKRAEILEAASPDLRGVLGKRLDQMKNLVETSEKMTNNSWKDDYQDRFGRSVLQMRKDGVSQKLPSVLTAAVVSEDKSGDPRRRRRDVVVKDERGKAFDNLRGSNSTFKAFHETMRKAGGNPNLLENWMDAQAGSSWSGLAQAYKYYVASQGKNKPKDYYWNDGEKKAKAYYEQAVAKYGGEEVFKKTFDAYHAFTYELLTRTEIPNIDRERGVAKLWRTETAVAVGDAKPGDKNKIGKRGAAESTSLLNPVFVKGDILTYQEIPLTDILGTYLTERRPGSGHSAFYGDQENEFVVVLGQAPFDYITKGVV